MRSTDVCHPNENVHPHLVRSRLTPQLSLRGPPTETKAPYETIGDPDGSRRPYRFGGPVLCADLDL